jgi:hypothetical protein
MRFRSLPSSLANSPGAGCPMRLIPPRLRPASSGFFQNSNRLSWPTVQPSMREPSGRQVQQKKEFFMCCSLLLVPAHDFDQRNSLACGAIDPAATNQADSYVNHKQTPASKNSGAIGLEIKAGRVTAGRKREVSRAPGVPAISCLLTSPRIPGRCCSRNPSRRSRGIRTCRAPGAPSFRSPSIVRHPG